MNKNGIIVKSYPTNIVFARAMKSCNMRVHIYILIQVLIQFVYTYSFINDNFKYSSYEYLPYEISKINLAIARHVNLNGAFGAVINVEEMDFWSEEYYSLTIYWLVKMINKVDIIAFDYRYVYIHV